jgi:ribosomal protein S18 acetylase RimI-like enzyme
MSEPQLAPSTQPLEIVIRPFVPDDMDRLYFLDQRCHEEGRRVTYAKWISVLLEKDVSALVAVEGTEAQPQPMLGGLVLQAEPWRGVMRVVALMVDPEFRRLGIARRLLDCVVRLGTSLRIREISMLQESEDEGLIGLLKGLGFQRTDELAPGLRGAEPKPLWSLGLGTSHGGPELPTESGS